MYLSPFEASLEHLPDRIHLCTKLNLSAYITQLFDILRFVSWLVVIVHFFLLLGRDLLNCHAHPRVHYASQRLSCQ